MEKDFKITTDAFHKRNFEKFIIVAEVSGNHTYSSIMGVKNQNTFEMIFKITLLTKDIDSISIILNYTLKMAKEMYDIEVDTCAIGVAGTITSPDRKAIKMTHYNLTIKVNEILLNTLLRKVFLVNDFEAMGYGIDFIDEDRDAVSIVHRKMGNQKRVREATACIIGAGYGLGTSILCYDKHKKMHIPIPCEAGHIDFLDISEKEFVAFIQEKILNNSRKIPDFERFVSGRGIIDYWHFLREKNSPKEDSEIARKIDFLLEDDKLNSIFIHYYLDPTCKKVIDTFKKFYAQYARNMALVSVPMGGLFIAGGIAHRHPEIFNTKEFVLEFEKSDRKEDLLEKIPIFIITKKELPLFGLCNVAVNFSDRI
jgi:glucokinase